jgi:hypothetical protein
MRSLRPLKHSAAAAYLVASALVAVGVWVFFHTQGKNGFDTLPLFWLFAVVSAPLLSLVCAAAMWRQKAPVWLASIATLFLLPQAIVWYFAVRAVLHYLGWIGW